MGGATGTTGQHGGKGVDGTVCDEDSVGLVAGTAGESGVDPACDPERADDPRWAGGVRAGESGAGVGLSDAWRAAELVVELVGSVGVRGGAWEARVGGRPIEADPPGELPSKVGGAGIPRLIARRWAAGWGSSAGGLGVGAGVGGWYGKIAS